MIFEGSFQIKEINKKFDKVSRITAESKKRTKNKKKLEIDVHDIFFNFLKNSEPIGSEFNMILSKDKLNIEDHEYGMNGTVFNQETDYILVSFGGLLFKFDLEKTENLLDTNIFCYLDSK